MSNKRCEHLLIGEQIERAVREAHNKWEGTSVVGVAEDGEKKWEEGLQCEEGEKKAVFTLSAKSSIAWQSALMMLL